MFSRQTALLHELRKWCACALILFMPGSLVVLPVLWMVKRLAVRFGSAHPAGTPAFRAGAAR